MKTRLLIIIGIIVAVAISITLISLVYNQEIKLATGMMISDEKPIPNSECIQPPSPHKFALWNEEYCWWFLYEPLVPFEYLKFVWGYGTNEDPLGEIKKWCEDNRGLWFPNNNDCKFIHDIDAKKAKADLESRENIKVTGNVANRICEIINFPCLEPPEFNGGYSLWSGKTFVNLYNQGMQYHFRLINDTMSYKICTEDKCEDRIEEKIQK